MDVETGKAQRTADGSVVMIYTESGRKQIPSRQVLYDGKNAGFEGWGCFHGRQPLLSVWYAVMQGAGVKDATRWQAYLLQVPISCGYATTLSSARIDWHPDCEGKCWSHL